MVLIDQKKTKTLLLFPTSVAVFDVFSILYLKAMKRVVVVVNEDVVLDCYKLKKKDTIFKILISYNLANINP